MTRRLGYPSTLLLAMTVACGGAPGPSERPAPAPVPSSTTPGAGKPIGSFPPWSFQPTTSVAELTANNTSASSSWTGNVTVGGKGLDASWDAKPGNVSKVPISALLGGYDVKVWVETQNWWGTPGHIDNGENSASSDQIAAQVKDQMSRGFAGQVVDWYGPGTVADKALPFIQSNAEASAGQYQFAVMIDKGYFSQGCGVTVACLNQAITYLASATASPAYLKDASGHPLVFFFINEYYGPEYDVLLSSGIDYQNTKFVMYEPNGFPGNAPAQTIGEYAWVHPADGHTGDYGFAGLLDFFNVAESDPSSTTWSAVYKGFDDNAASWSMDRVIDQACGQTWLQTFEHSGSFGGSASYLGNVNYLKLGKHLDAIMVDTWDDYEEGTEIETGIDNCLPSLGVTLAGKELSWVPNWGKDPMDPSVSGTEATVFKYGVYVAKAGGTSLMWLADVACKGGTCGHSIDVSAFGITGGSYVFYVQAVGQPSIKNTLSGATAATYDP